MDCCNVVSNYGSINYTDPSGNITITDTNTVITNIITPSNSITHCSEYCEIVKCNGEVLIKNIYCLCNKSPYYIYNICSRITIPQEYNYVNGTFYMNSTGNFYPDQLTLFIPYIPACSKICFSFYTKSNYILPVQSIISSADTNYVYYDLSGRYLTDSFNSQLIK